ncbi:PstS family phosphate ABC transporter substrate-binding protein [Stella sp.]|uniref:PstS family phosphate ABC transporter substrate-binding protein n=1 Tax=Stella sp. TaxID=2912054 RepID=UPI0035B0188E
MIRSLLVLAAGAVAASIGLAGTGYAQGMLTLRDRLLIVSSNSTVMTATQLTGAFAERYQGVQRPDLRFADTRPAMEFFCSGIGPETPDIAILSRRMPATMRETCLENGVRDIVEVQIGLGAIVLATNRGDPTPELTTRQVYEAVAAERTVGEGFEPNRAVSWSQIDPHLPNMPIRVIVPAEGSSTRRFFEDLVLEAGCRYVRGIRLLFEAAYRRAKCITMRDDGAIVSAPLLDVAAVLLASPPGTIGVVPLTDVTGSGGNLIALALDGVHPDAATVSSLDYEQTRAFFLYAKRQHSRNRSGIGVVRGIHEMLAEATSEAAFGPGGYLSNAGLIPLPPADRLAQRRIAERMTPMSSR